MGEPVKDDDELSRNPALFDEHYICHMCPLPARFKAPFRSAPITVTAKIWYNICVNHVSEIGAVFRHQFLCHVMGFSVRCRVSSFVCFFLLITYRPEP